MEREDDVIELGAASAVTQGGGDAIGDDVVKQFLAGLSAD